MIPSGEVIGPLSKGHIVNVNVTLLSYSGVTKGFDVQGINERSEKKRIININPEIIMVAITFRALGSNIFLYFIN